MDGTIKPQPEAASSKPGEEVGKVAALDPVAWQQELGGLIGSVERAAQEWGLRPDCREGKFVAALLGTTRWLGRLSLSAHAGFEALGHQQRSAAALELARAQEITKAANVALSQARNALIGMEAERENVVVRMIHETLPLFVERLQEVLIIRETSWNQDQRRRRYAVAGALTLGLFLGGYALRSWVDDGASGALEACLAHPVQAQGHVYCDVTRFAVPGQ